MQVEELVKQRLIKNCSGRGTLCSLRRANRYFTYYFLLMVNELLAFTRLVFVERLIHLTFLRYAITHTICHHDIGMASSYSTGDRR